MAYIMKKRSPVSIEEAQEMIVTGIRPLGGETVPLLESPGRILSDDIISDVMVPNVADSAMDGYAVIAEDIKGASRERPVRLKVIGEARAGGTYMDKMVTRGTTIRIATGAPIPDGADAVIPIEETDEDGGYAIIYSTVEKNKNIRSAGEIIRKGDKVLNIGDLIGSIEVGIIASIGLKEINVYKRPICSIIATGDELVPTGEEIKDGQKRDSNAYILYCETKRHSAIPEYLGIARDRIEDIETMFRKAMDSLDSDIIITIGGVSVGRYDLVKEVYNRLGIEIEFDEVRIRPGNHCLFGRKGKRLFFGLPGNPVPCFTSYLLFIRPAVLRLMGAKRIKKPAVNAILEKDINKRTAGRPQLLRGYFTVTDNEFYVVPTVNQKPSGISSLSQANCLIVVPENTERLRAGEKVPIILMKHEEI